MRFRPPVIVAAFLPVMIGLTASLNSAQSQLAANDPPQPSRILFENVRIFNGTSAQLSAPSNVLVVNNKIKTISTTPIAAPGAGLTKIKGGGRVLMPGLIDNHVHIFMSASSQTDLINPQISPETLQLRATEEAKQMLLRGFTTVRDVGGPVFELKAAIDQGKTPGPRIYPSGATISQTSGHGDARLPKERSRRFGGTLSRGELLGVGFIADGRDEVLTATRENLRAGATQIKVMAGGGAASAYDPLDVTQYTLDEMTAAVEAAADWGTYVTVHAYTPKAVQRAIAAGVKCIEHGQLLDEPTLKLLAAKGIWLSLQALDEAPPEASELVKAKKRQVVQGTNNAFLWAKKYNVKLAWGTDFLFNPANNKNQNADLLKLKQWLTGFETLKLVTHDNGQLLTLSGPRNPYPGKLGVIEEGAYADLLLVEGNPLQDISVMVNYAQNFKVILKDGKVYKNTL
jgi:imidazolonepropionase-like amidohydrolase